MLGGTFCKRNHAAVAKEAAHESSVIARSETTKQSALAVWGIATGLRPRNDSPIVCQINNSLCQKFPPAPAQKLSIIANKLT
jgi:hypothetical protein